MKPIRMRILDLLDQHGKTYETCKGCVICTEITQLRKKLERTSQEKFQHILGKGQDMKRNDLELLIENGVIHKTIRQALGMNANEYFDLIHNLNLGKRGKDMAKISLETYQDYKAQGLADKEIAEKVQMNPQYLSQLKKQWGNSPQLTVVKEKKPHECNCTKDDKTAEYEQLIKVLREDLNEAHKQLDEKDEQIRKLENVDAACDDVENEVAELREEKQKLQDDCSKLLEKQYQDSYTLENWKNRMRSVVNENEKLQKENKAMKELLRLCL